MIKSIKYLACILTVSSIFGGGQAWATATPWQGKLPAYEQVKINKTMSGPTLLFSDSPEMIRECGVMYRDKVQGPTRLFFHHVNDTKSAKRLAVVLRNTGIRRVEVNVGRKGISKPDKNWLRAGKEVQIDYFSNLKPTSFTLRPGQKYELLTAKTGKVIHPQEIITGMVDLSFSHPVEVSFMMIPLESDFDAAVDVYEVLPADKGEYVLRGTFFAADCGIELDDSYDNEDDGVWGLTLADNKLDKYIKGIDATTGKPVTNYGNYGVIYTLDFATKGDDNTVVHFNPWGGPYAGAVLWQDKSTHKLIKIPAQQLSVGEFGKDISLPLVTVVGRSKDKLMLSSPGGSYLPIRLFWEGQKKKK